MRSGRSELNQTRSARNFITKRQERQTRRRETPLKGLRASQTMLHFSRCGNHRTSPLFAGGRSGIAVFAATLLRALLLGLLGQCRLDGHRGFLAFLRGSFFRHDDSPWLWGFFFGPALRAVRYELHKGSSIRGPARLQPVLCPRLQGLLKLFDGICLPRRQKLRRGLKRNDEIIV